MRHESDQDPIEDNHPPACTGHFSKGSSVSRTIPNTETTRAVNYAGAMRMVGLVKRPRAAQVTPSRVHAVVMNGVAKDT